MRDRTKQRTMHGKPCVKCGSTERYSRGQCAACSRAKAAQWKRDNRDRQLAALAKWRADNPDRVAANMAAWRAANVERMIAYSASYRRENLEAVLRRLAEWRQRNPLHWKVHQQNRRARISGEKLSRGLGDRLMIVQKGRCACCGADIRKTYHLDHIRPLARGGRNVDSNIQLLCPTCNQSKHAKDPIDFMRSRGLLL